MPVSFAYYKKEVWFMEDLLRVGVIGKYTWNTRGSKGISDYG